MGVKTNFLHKLASDSSISGKLGDEYLVASANKMVYYVRRRSVSTGAAKPLATWEALDDAGR